MERFFILILGSDEINVVKEELTEINDGLEDRLAHGNVGAVAFGESGCAFAGHRPRSFYKIRDDGVEALGMAVSKDPADILRNVTGLNNTGAEGIAEVMVDVGDGIAEAADFGFEANLLVGLTNRIEATAPLGVVEDTLPNFPGKVESLSFFLQHINDAQALLSMSEAAGDSFSKKIFAKVAKRRVAKVMRQRYGFSEVFIETQSPSDGSRNLSNFNGVGESCGEVVAQGGNKDLRLVLEAPKCLGVDYSVTVSLVFGAHEGRFFGYAPPLRFMTELSKRGEGVLLLPLHSKTDTMIIHRQRRILQPLPSPAVRAAPASTASDTNKNSPCQGFRNKDNHAYRGCQIF